MTPAPRILVVNGHSNAGKSFFCSWLASAHGCTVVDCDKGGIDAAGLRVPWDAVAAGDASPLRAELASQGIGVTTVVPGLMRTGSPLNAFAIIPQ